MQMLWSGAPQIPLMFSLSELPHCQPSSPLLLDVSGAFLCPKRSARSGSSQRCSIRTPSCGVTSSTRARRRMGCQQRGGRSDLKAALAAADP